MMPVLPQPARMHGAREDCVAEGEGGGAWMVETEGLGDGVPAMLSSAQAVKCTL